MRRFLLPNNTAITEKALRDLYGRVRAVVLDRDKSDARSLAEETLKAFDTFFKGLGKPQFEHTEILPDDPLIPEDFNDLLQRVIADVQLGYEEVVNLRNAAIAAHNYSSMHVSELQRRAEEIASLVTDLRLLSDQFGEEVVVFSDNFNDDSKLDPAFPLEHLPAQVMPGMRALTLNRVGVDSPDLEEIDIQVTSLSDLSTEPTADNVGRFYEGHFYSFLGEAEPEGGVFHLEEILNRDTLEGIDQAAFEIPELPRGRGRRKRRRRRRLLRDFVVPGGAEAKFLEQVKEGLFNDRFGLGRRGKRRFRRFVRRRRRQLHRKDRPLRRQYMYYSRNPEVAEAAGFNLNTTEIPLTAENFIVVDKGGTEEEKQAIRQNMVDGNPASYWQCELVRSTNVIQDAVSREVEEIENAEVTAEELRRLAESSAVDREDFEIQVVFTFDTPRDMNWITLNPMTFDDNAYLEVFDVSTAPDEESDFEQVDSFATRRFANFLTDEANEELPSDIASFLLAPNRFSYRGMGIWPFAARQVQKVRFKLRQRVPVPNPYEKIVLEAERTHNTRVRRRRRRN